jgi:hypothetical protein
MGAHVLLDLRVENFFNSKPERKVDSLPLLGLDPATFARNNARPTPLRNSKKES